MVNVDEDIIISLINLSFSARCMDEKNEILKRGRPTPELPELKMFCKSKRENFTRHFNKKHYDESEWLAGSLKKINFIVGLVYYFLNDLKDQFGTLMGFRT